jgi:hypothetical protein
MPEVEPCGRLQVALFEKTTKHIIEPLLTTGINASVFACVAPAPIPAKGLAHAVRSRSIDRSHRWPRGEHR